MEYSSCHYPYTSIHIDPNGEVTCCCHSWCSSYSFGNIFKQPFNEIWNGERAQEFRKQFQTKNYKYCKLDICLNDSERKFETALTAEKYPQSVGLAYDSICNVECIFCRDCGQRSDTSKFEKTMNVWIPEILKDAEKVLVSALGEALASPHTRKVMKKIVQVYPKIKFDILTNGVLMDEKNLTEVGIINNLGDLRFSVHAIKESTYNKIVKKGNFKKVMQNIKYIAELKKQGKVQSLEFRFVINSINYKEMIPFAQMAKEYGANVTFLCLIYNQCIKDFKKLNVLDKNHKDYNQVVKILKHPIFRENFVFINKELLNAKPISLQEKLSNLFHLKKDNK